MFFLSFMKHLLHCGWLIYSEYCNQLFLQASQPCKMRRLDNVASHLSPSPSLVHVERADGGIAILTIDNPPVNALGLHVAKVIVDG
jgi:hypothetical protein